MIGAAGCNSDSTPDAIFSGPMALPSPTPSIGFPRPSENPPSSTLSPPEPVRVWEKDALIYNGSATATGGAEAIVAILDSVGMTYDLVGSSALNSMPAEDMKKYGTWIWPGGYAGQMSASLTRATRDRIQSSVIRDGVSFVGFCAGAFIAVSPDTSWGFSLIDRPTLPYYYLEDMGVSAAMVGVEGWNGQGRKLLWWGGPKLTGFSEEETLARYAETQEPAITQSHLSSGAKVILAGPHPEAPESWRTQLGLRDSDGMDQDIAPEMFQRALEP